ncbi:MAG: cytochrome c oxidase subunit 3 [Rhodospirillales bacterium]|nr:cytochrome c oxidase subunit 3 [Rhodospirillales bacterium]
MSSEVKKHPWHMVEPSKWPFVGTIGAFVAAIGGVWYMQEGPIWGFLLGVLIILYTMFGWWRDVVNEAQSGVDHTSPVQHGLRFGMVLFIVSEVMFFFAFFWAYFNASVPFLGIASGVWPPEGVVPLETWGLPFLNTLILLTSGATVTWAHHALRVNNRKQLIIGLALTVFLGFLFIGTQAYEYGEAAFGFKDGIYSSTFYLATGFHGFHVFVGACFLTVCLFRASKGHFTSEQHVGFEAAAWYWHFVDVVWLFLFTCVYWWGSFGHVPS